MKLQTALRFVLIVFAVSFAAPIRLANALAALRARSARLWPALGRTASKAYSYQFSRAAFARALIAVWAVTGCPGAESLFAATQVLSWAPDTFGVPATTPQLLTVTNVTSVAGGTDGTLGLQADGRVSVVERRTWATFYEPPPALTTAVALAARSYSAAALRASGQLVIWGGIPRIPPAGLSNVVAVAVGNWQTVALRSDGTVATWGNPEYSAGTNTPPGLNDVVAIASGRYNSLALKADGNVVAWGALSSLANIVPADATNVIAIAAGWAGAGDQNAVLRSDGTVIAWNDAFSFRPFSGQTNIVDIAAGADLLLAITGDGHVLGAVPGLDAVTNALEISPMDFGPRFLVLTGDGSPLIVHEPANTTGFTGQKLRLVAKVAGERPLALQWLKGGLPISGATNAVLVLENASSDNIGSYQLTATNTKGSAASRAATLQVIQSAPRLRAIALEPPTGVSYVGGTATLNADVFGSMPISFQWQFEGATIPGATNATLHLTSLRPDQAGRYSVLVSNSVGFVSVGPVPLGVSGVVAWGGNFDRELEVPATATNVVDIFAGEFHSGALRADGTVVVWGNLPSSGNRSGGDLRPPAGLSNVVAVAGGDGFNVALKADGRLVAWGDNSFGQRTGLAQLSNIVAVAAGHAHTLTLRADGVLIAVGGNIDGQLDLPHDLDDYVAIAAGVEFSLALRSDGTLVKAGHNLPSIPTEATNIVAISAGQYHALALRSDGTLIAWGAGMSMPSAVPDVAAIAAGGRHSLVLRGDGHVVSWGGNWLGQATVPTDLSNVIAIAAGFSHSLALISEGPPRIIQQPRGLAGIIGGNARLVVRANGTQPVRYQWWQNGSELVGATNAVLALDGLSMFDNGNYELIIANSYGAVTSQVATISVVTSPPFSLSIYAEPANRIAVLGGTAEFSAQAQGTPPLGYRWFFEGQPPFSARDSTLRLDNLRFADAGNYRVAVANPFGVDTSAPVRLSVVNVAVWGARNAGSDPQVFKVPASVTNMVALSASQWAVAGVRSDHTAVGWGAPVPPSSATNLTTVAVGGEFGLGLRVDGSVVAWGANSFGIQPLPDGLSNVIQLSAAYSWALALKADGTVVQWGTYIGGWMTPPPPLSNVVQISAGARHALARLRDGTVIGWGSDDCGQVNPPTGLSNVVAIVAGNCYSMALREDGRVVEWGRDTYSPPSDATNLVAIATGNFHRVGLREDGKVFSWGFENGNAGQTRVPRDLPPVVAIAAAGDASFAIAPATGEPHIARHPRRQTLSSGQRLQLETRLFPGSSNVTLQWFKDGAELPEETSPILLREFSVASDSGRYRVVARNSFGTDSSREVEVQIADQPPFIIKEPQDVAADAGENASFDLAAGGSLPLAYRWLFNGDPLISATNNVLILSMIGSADAGGYSVEVSNAFGSSFSRVATLRLRPMPVLQPTDLSIDSSGRFHCLIRGEPGQVVFVQWSENMRDWQYAETLTLGDFLVEWIDLDTSPRPQRFYRLVSPVP